MQTLAEFEQEFLQMGDEADFQLPFVKTGVQCQEIEQVGVFQGLLHQVGIRRRQA